MTDCKRCEAYREALKKALLHFAAISKGSAPMRPSGQSELCGLIDELESQAIIGMGVVEAALAAPAAVEQEKPNE